MRVGWIDVLSFRNFLFQGYKKILKEIFEEAGLLKATEEEEVEKQNKKSVEFETVEKCSKV